MHEKLKKAKKPNSTVPGDIPKKIINEFSVEYSRPIMLLMNRITKTGEYPRQWVAEYQTPIPKSHPPMTENDLRLISCTAFVSKVYESFLRDWLMPIISPHLDSSNYGGMKGSSTTHLLLNLLHFVHSQVEKTQPHAVLLQGQGI